MKFQHNAQDEIVRVVKIPLSRKWLGVGKVDKYWNVNNVNKWSWWVANTLGNYIR
jgi:hypothetical protein